MEEAVRFPQATLTGIQFGLSSSREISKVSVYGMSSIQHPTQLVNARLGLPVKSSKCETCGTEKPDECDGHFGHIRLPTPIYHPSHVEELKRILSKICLNCFRLKEQKEPQDPGNPVRGVEGSGVTFKIHKDSKVSKNLKAAEDSCNFVSPGSSFGGNNKDFKKQKKSKVKNNSKMKKGPAHVASHVPSLTDNYEAFDKQSRGETSKTSKTAKESAGFPSPIPSMADYVAFEKQSRGETSKNTKTGKEPADFASSFPSTPNYVAFEKQSRGENSVNIKAAKVTMNTKTAKVKSLDKLGAADRGKQKLKQSSVIHGDLFFLKKSLNESQNRKGCPYCQTFNKEAAESYPTITVKVVCKPEGIKTLELETSSKKGVPSDFWSFLERYGYESSNSSSRSLLPFEALKILEQIPRKTLQKLRVETSVIQPGALILDCLPVPPNCVRIPDMWGIPLMTSDHAIHMLKKLLVLLKRSKTQGLTKLNLWHMG